jgi:hypothetical protein
LVLDDGLQLFVDLGDQFSRLLVESVQLGVGEVHVFLVLLVHCPEILKGLNVLSKIYCSDLKTPELIYLRVLLGLLHPHLHLYVLLLLQLLTLVQAVLLRLVAYLLVQGPVQTHSR